MTQNKLLNSVTELRITKMYYNCQDKRPLQSKEGRTSPNKCLYKDFISKYLANVHNRGSGGVNHNGAVSLEGVGYKRGAQAIKRNHRIFRTLEN